MTLTIAVLALIVIVVGYGWLCARQQARTRALSSALNAELVMRAIRTNHVQRSLERVRAELARALTENEQLAELARKRHELLRAACLVLDVTIPEPPRDTDLVQGIRAAATAHGRQVDRLGDEVELRDLALAAVASLVLLESVKPGEFQPRKLVQMVDDHLAACRSQA